MAACNDVIGYLDELLEPMVYDDYGPNGLQVPGRDEIESVATGVSANAELFTRAREEGVDLVLVHHGLSRAWPQPPPASRWPSSTSRTPSDTRRAYARWSFVRSERPFGQKSLSLSGTSAIRSERRKPTGGKSLRWQIT
jgi:NIF3 (NGG1p interacting factor 3)